MGRPSSSLTVTVMRSVLMLEMVLCTEFVAPDTSETSTTSAMTPMMMPSIVRKDRSLFEAMEFHAILKDCKSISAAPLLC